MQSSISNVNGVNPVLDGGHGRKTVSLPEVVADHMLTVAGSTDCDGAIVCCALVRHGMDPNELSETNETVSTEARFAKVTSKKWNVTFKVTHAARYMVTCHTRTAKGDYSDTND